MLSTTLKIRFVAMLVLAGAINMGALAKAITPAVARERDTADKVDILRYYDWKKTPKSEYDQCEGRLDYDFEITESGWYVLEQQGAPCEWGRNIYVDGVLELDKLETEEDDILPGVPKNKAWHKEGNFYLTKGRHSLGYERTSFPGAFPQRWRLVPSDGTVRGTVRLELSTDVVRTDDEFVISARLGTKTPISYEIVAMGLSLDETNVLTVVEMPARGTPETRKISVKAPSKQGIYRVTVRENGVVGWKSDVSAKDLVVIGRKPEAVGETLKKTLVVDIDCVKTAPFVERDGATRIVKKPYGTYRESSGAALVPGWGVDGFSYNYQIPDTKHTYLLEVTYPDDAFRSIGFWSNDAGPIGGKTQRQAGQILTGGVETGGQYRNTMSMLTHEAFFYPTGTNIVLAIANMNSGSRAAASRIRVYRIDGPLPAAPEGTRRGRLAGAFFEENGRWRRFFGEGNDANPRKHRLTENLRTMERWGEWNRFAGVNTMSPSVCAYAGVHYPSKVVSGSHVSPENEMRMLALIAEKYGNVFIPHVTFHGDAVFDRRMGITENGRELSFADPDVIEWSKEGKTVIAWRQWSYNCLHPKVQAYLLAAVDEIVEMLADTKSFQGLSLRIPLGWQFTGITGLNNDNYGYGDWTVAEFTKDTGIVVPGKAEDPKRFGERHAFLTSPEHRAEWIKWRTGRIKDYYRRIREHLNAKGGNRELYFSWWSSGKGTMTEEMTECGLAPEAWRDEPGISFFGQQVFFGRRCFTPLWSLMLQHRLYDPDYLGMSESGRRAIGVYSDYYEPNNHFGWEKFGGADYTAFDALEPAGFYERQSYAVPLAMIDAGVFFSGGNGWIFGTPAKTRGFMREFLALPSERFTSVPNVPQDPVVVRERLTKEGRFVYFVNGSDVPVDVSFNLKGRGKLVAAADGAEVPSRSFTLEPFGLRSFLVKKPFFGKPACVSAVRATPKALPPTDGLVAELKSLCADAKARKVAVEMRKDHFECAMAAAQKAIEGCEKGRPLQLDGAETDPALLQLFTLSGRWPQEILSSDSRMGGWPADAKDKPTLKPMRRWGGDPMEGPGPYRKVWTATDGQRTWLSFETGAHGQLREFDAEGRYVRSGTLTFYSDRTFCKSDSRGAFLRDPAYLYGGPIVYTNGFLYSGFGGETPKFDVNDNFRQVAGESERKIEIPRNEAKSPKLKPREKNFIVPSQLKVKDKALLYRDLDGVWSFNPSTGVRKRVKEVDGGKAGFVFDVTPSGRLVTLSARAGDVMLTDLLANDDGSMIRRIQPWDHLHFAKFAADGSSERIWDFDYRDFRQGDRFGLCRGKDGTIYVAGAGSRRVAAFRPDGTRLWEKKWCAAESHARGDLPFRSPSSCAIDSKGRLWVSDLATDQLIVLDGKDGRFLGTYGYSATIDDKSGFGFSSISGLAIIGERLYVLDSGNLRLLEFEIGD